MSGFIEAVERAQENREKLWQETNTLLALLRSLDVVELVNEYFRGCHDNTAPGELLVNQITEVQKMLDAIRCNN